MSCLITINPTKPPRPSIRTTPAAWQAVAPYMNKRYTLIPDDLLDPGDRVFSDRDIITMDLIPSRLNVAYRHGNKRVYKLGCY